MMASPVLAVHPEGGKTSLSGDTLLRLYLAAQLQRLLTACGRDGAHA
jgi:hypothetical protein